MTTSSQLTASPFPAQATVLIARVARVVRQRSEQALGPLGLRQRQIVALSYLRQHGPTAQALLAEQLCMDASSTVCLLNELEESGLVLRSRDRTDRRRGIIELSSGGLAALDGVTRALEAIDEEILANLDQDERATLRDLLSRLSFAQPDWSLAAADG